MDGILQLASGDATFFDATFLYIAGGLLVVLALVGSFLGMRKEDFPTGSQSRILGGLAVLLVLCTCTGAVLSARFEQSERRAENEEAAKEAGEEEQLKEDEEAPLTEGEAAEPDTATGEASSPPEEATGAAKSDVDGMALFVDTGCGDCHTLADAETSGTIGPVLDDVVPEMTPEMIRTSIIEPGAEVEEGFPDGVMPSDYSDVLDEVELDTLVAYLSDAAGK